MNERTQHEADNCAADNGLVPVKHLSASVVVAESILLDHSAVHRHGLGLDVVSCSIGQAEAIKLDFDIRGLDISPLMNIKHAPIDLVPLGRS